MWVTKAIQKLEVIMIDRYDNRISIKNIPNKEGL